MRSETLLPLGGVALIGGAFALLYWDTQLPLQPGARMGLRAMMSGIGFSLLLFWVASTAHRGAAFWGKASVRLRQIMWRVFRGLGVAYLLLSLLNGVGWTLGWIR